MAWLETRESLTAAIAPRLNRTSPNLGAGFILHGPNVNYVSTAGAARFFACPRLVLLTMGDGRSTAKYFVLSTSVHHATRCALAACGDTFQLLEWQIRPWPLVCGDLGKGEFLTSCYSGT